MPAKEIAGRFRCQVSYRSKAAKRERRLRDRLVTGNIGQRTEQNTRWPRRFQPAGSAGGAPFEGHRPGRTRYPVSRPRAMVLAQRLQAPVRAEHHVDATIGAYQHRELAIFAADLPGGSKQLFGIPEKRIHENLIAAAGYSLNCRGCLSGKTSPLRTAEGRGRPAARC